VLINNAHSCCDVDFWTKHLGNTEANERAELKEIRGLKADNLAQALNEMQALARDHPRTKNFMYHADFNPRHEEHLTPEQRDRAFEIFEKERGIPSDAARIVMEHVKEGRQHWHVIWYRLDDTGRPFSDKLDAKVAHRAAEKISHEMGFEKVVSPLTREPGAPRPERAPEPWEMYRGDKTGLDTREVTAEVTSLLQLCENDGKAFSQALETRGYILARGDKMIAGQPALMIIDLAGNDHHLPRRIKGLKAEQVNELMRHIDRASLPTIPQAKDSYQERKIAALEADRATVRQEIEREEALATAAIEKEKIEERFLAKEDREQETRAGRDEAQKQIDAINEATRRNLERDKADLDKFIAAELYKRLKEAPGQEMQPQPMITPGVEAELAKLIQAEEAEAQKQIDAINEATRRGLERDKADLDKFIAAELLKQWQQRDPVREQIAWEDALAKAAIEKEKQERQFVGKPEKEQHPARPCFGDVLIARAARDAMQDERQQHGDHLTSPAAFRDALENNRLGLACVTPEEAAKSHREAKFAKAVERYAPEYHAEEIVILREPRNEGNTGGRVHKLDQTKAEDYLRGLGIDKSQLQSIEATKQTLNDRAQIRQRAIEAAEQRKARGPQRGGLVAQEMWAMQRVREADRQRRLSPYRPDERQEQERRQREYAEKQRRDSSELDPERYRLDPEYRRQMQDTHAYKSPEEKKRDRENEVRAIMEQQDRGR
jgi:hypothetical protein